MRSQIEVSKTFFDQKAVQTILFSIVHSLQNHKPKNNINNIGYLKADIKILQKTFNYSLYIYLQDFHKVQQVKSISYLQKPF